MGSTPPPLKFQSFAKVEPNSHFRGMYIHNNLIRICVSFTCKLSGTPGWLAVWDLNPDWLGRKFNLATIQRFGEASTPEGGRGLCSVVASFCALKFALQLRKSMEKPQLRHQRRRKTAARASHQML
jgi:hypothetical protein